MTTKNTTTYMAIIQLMGVKDLAYVEFDIFNEILSDTFPDIAKETSIDIGNCNVITFLDYCICESHDLNIVLDYSVKFRQKLIERIGIMCRGYITSSDMPILKNGKLSLLDYDRKELPANASFEGYQFRNSKAISVLFSELNLIKGLSLKIDERIIYKKIEKFCFINYYSEYYDSLIVNSYYDLKFESKNLSQFEINKIFKSMEQYYYSSPKFVSFFVPLLNNIILNWTLNPDDKNEDYFLPSLFSSNYFNKFYKIKGMNLIFLFFIKHKILETKEFIDNFPEVLDGLKKNLRLISFLRKDSIMEIPKSLFNYKDKFKFFALLHPKN